MGSVPVVTALQIYWFLIATLLYFGAGYLWQVWWQVRGIRGLALATAMTCGGIITSCFGILQSHQAIVSDVWLLAIHRACWWPLLLSGLVLADLYASDHNDHRSVTTKVYLYYKRMTTRVSDVDRL